MISEMTGFLKQFIAGHPWIAVVSAALAGYYGGPKGSAALASIAHSLGLV